MKHTNRTLSILLALLMLFSAATTAFAAGSLTLQSVTIGDTPLAEATEIRSNAEITLTFSAKVTDDSILAFNISKINVKDSAGNNVTSVTVSKDGGKKFVVSLGGVAKGDYTLTIGKDFKDIDGNTLGQKVERTFTVNKGDGNGSGGGNGENPLNFVSAVADGKDLNGAALAQTGSITITFNRGMTDYQAQNFEQIGIYDESGSKVDGVTFTDFKKDADANSFTVLSYQNLAGGAYTLKLGKDLKANNEKTLGEDVVISFTVKAAVPQEPDSGDNTDDNNGKTNFFTNFINAIVKFFRSLIDFFRNIGK